MRASLEQRIQQLQSRLATKKAQEKAAQRKADTRGKIILGGIFIARLEKQPEEKAHVLRLVQDRDKPIVARLLGLNEKE